MDRKRPAGSWPSEAVPRTRGDGPRGVAKPRRVSSLFPAHAGMDLIGQFIQVGPEPVPRTRGDGPVLTPPSTEDHPLFPAHAGMDRPAELDPRLVFLCSPHTRGWTQHPAHGSAPRNPVPRTRGDGPGCSCVLMARISCSPHTRGWTEGTGDAGIDRALFPAHAGMDRSGAICGTSWIPVPRTRGDGPVVCPPPPSPPPLFPAHAGMDRSRRAPCGISVSVPRTRGDGPCSWAPSARRHPCSPHTRGWTELNEARKYIPRNCSPHTRGWTERDLACPEAQRPVPRTRGDGPPMTSLMLPLCFLFPAHAGMDRDKSEQSSSSRTVPRTRGDGPQWKGTKATIKPLFPAHAGMDRRPPSSGGRTGSCSPHTRGWTGLSRSPAHYHALFPAHAGMDRPGSGWRPWHRAVPRTRGDGPSPLSAL